MDCDVDSNYYTYGCNTFCWIDNNNFNAFIHSFWFLIILNIIEGDIRLFRKKNTFAFKLIAEAHDPEPFFIDHIGFGSSNAKLAKFYFNCSFSVATPDAIYDTTDHPLLVNTVLASINLKNRKWIWFQLFQISYSSLFLRLSPSFSLKFPYIYSSSHRMFDVQS